MMLTTALTRPYRSFFTPVLLPTFILLGTILQGTALVGTVLVGTTQQVHAQAGVTYPKVYGPTGSLYGPTRAFDAYRSQYGRDWVPHNRGNFSQSYSGQRNRNYGNYVTQLPSYPGNYRSNYRYGHNHWHGGHNYYAPGYSPLVIPYVPGLINPPVFTSPLYGNTYYPYQPPTPYYIPNQSLSHNGILQGTQIPSLPYDPTLLEFGQQTFPYTPTADDLLREQQLQQHWQHQTAKPVIPSTLTDQLASQRHQTSGDAALRSGSYSRALSKFQHAAAVAPDLTRPHQQLGYTMFLMGRFEEAAEEWKTALQLDQTWPEHAQTISEVLGEDWRGRADVQFSRLVDWVKEDYENPERVWAFGISLFLFEKYEESAAVLGTLDQLPNRTVDPSSVLLEITRKMNPTPMPSFLTNQIPVEQPAGQQASSTLNQFPQFSPEPKPAQPNSPDWFVPPVPEAVPPAPQFDGAGESGPLLVPQNVK